MVDKFSYGKGVMAEKPCPVAAAGYDPGKRAVIRVSQHFDSALVQLGHVDANIPSNAGRGIDDMGVVHPDFAREAMQHAAEEIREKYEEGGEYDQIAQDVLEHHGWG